MNVMAPVGTPVSHLIKLAGGFKTDPDRVLYGGPMMGNPIFNLDVPMMKSTNCILCMTTEEAARPGPGPDLHPLRQVRGGLPHAPDAPCSCE